MMLHIDKDNNITLTRGDALALTLSLYKEVPPVAPEAEPTVVPYEPTEGDTIRFAISKGYKGEPEYKFILEQEIPINTLMLVLTSEQTKIPNGEYNYDIEITHADGKPDTFISARFMITGEVK